MNSSDSAEELIKIYLDGVGFTLKIAGEGSKNLITFLIALSKDNKQTKGKTRLYRKKQRFEKIYARSKKIWSSILCISR